MNLIDREGRPSSCCSRSTERQIGALLLSFAGAVRIRPREANDEEESATNRRMSIQPIGRELQSWNWKGMLKLWSLLVFVVEEITLPLGLQLLRVLDIEDAPIEVLPEELVDLFNLRYLNLKGTRVKELPKSIGRLCNLNTLDITNSKIEVLPAGITELQNLRHLMMYHFDYRRLDDFHFGRGTTTPSNICKLKNLQVLAGVEAQADLMKRIRNMTQLKRIGITKWPRLTEDPIPYIQALPNLGRLFLCNAYEGGQLRFSEGFRKLRTLNLWKFPQLNEIIIERGVMPGLQQFYTGECMQLKILPHGIEYLEDLQELHLMCVTNELIECICGEGSKDHQKCCGCGVADGFLLSNSCSSEFSELYICCVGYLLSNSCSLEFSGLYGGASLLS
ncbi:hypothetical protein TEA_017996 [Camellia sinensis var. sinensis]|uniref:Disease resistance R13L4/SHOC-2-like LRR domain-containing protein n=1 Tax=Camellia sinensis var. sinensis TaxID=542762 RepID=A0A4S4ELS9_CAMSN|nr:hypothetical protein TEA_017996 [Camellia sinensis var. sinensis]